LRLYSSSSFGLFNKGMREKTNPLPIRVSVYVLHEALKKLRKVAAEENPNGYNKVKIFVSWHEGHESRLCRVREDWRH
jgi:hypothetical protein